MTILRRVLGVCALVAGVVALAMALFFLLTVVYHVYVDREGLPDIGPFARFEFPTVGPQSSFAAPSSHPARP